MSDPITQHAEHNDSLNIPPKHVKPNQVYVRKGIRASKNIFQKKSQEKSKTLADLTFGISNAPDDNPSASQVIETCQGLQGENSQKVFFAALNSQVGGCATVMCQDRRERGRKDEKNLGDSLRKISGGKNLVKNANQEISFMCEKTPKNDENGEKATFGETVANQNPARGSSKGPMRCHKRQKINLFRSKNKRRMDRAVTTSICGYGEFRFMKPKFLKSVTTVMQAKNSKVQIHLKNLEENRVPSI